MAKQRVRTMTVRTMDTFDAAHSLPNMGKCAEVHGHTWTVEIEVSADPEYAKDGILVDFSHLKHFIRRYDHKNLNDFFEFPSAENIAQKVLDDIEEMVLFPHTIKVVVWESPTSFAAVEDIFYEDDEE